MEIERPPHISKKDLFSAMLHQPSAHVGDMIYKINYCCPIKPLYTAISSLNPAEIGMISSYFKS